MVNMKFVPIISMYSSINIVYEKNVFLDFKLVPQNDYLVIHG